MSEGQRKCRKEERRALNRTKDVRREGGKEGEGREGEGRRKGRRREEGRGGRVDPLSPA